MLIIMQLQNTLKLPLVGKVWTPRGGLRPANSVKKPCRAMLMALSANGLSVPSDLTMPNSYGSRNLIPMTANGIVTSAACYRDLASRQRNEQSVPERNMTTAFVVTSRRLSA